jgi:hypothetical protein
MLVAEWCRQWVPNLLTRVRIPSDIKDLELEEAGEEDQEEFLDPGKTAERWLSG